MEPTEPTEPTAPQGLRATRATGATGIQGPKGDPGIQGIQGHGPAGPAGVSGVEIVTAASPTNSTAKTAVTATCTGGQDHRRRRSDVSIASANVAIIQSGPGTVTRGRPLDLGGRRRRETKQQAGNWTVTAYAICATG